MVVPRTVVSVITRQDEPQRQDEHEDDGSGTGPAGAGHGARDHGEHGGRRRYGAHCSCEGTCARPALLALRQDDKPQEVAGQVDGFGDRQHADGRDRRLPPLPKTAVVTGPAGTAPQRRPRHREPRATTRRHKLWRRAARGASAAGAAMSRNDRIPTTSLSVTLDRAMAYWPAGRSPHSREVKNAGSPPAAPSVTGGAAVPGSVWGPPGRRRSSRPGSRRCPRATARC